MLLPSSACITVALPCSSSPGSGLKTASSSTPYDWTSGDWRMTQVVTPFTTSRPCPVLFFPLR